MDFTPTFDRVLIKPDEEENVTSGGIILTEAVTSSFHYGTIVSVGPGAPNLMGNFEATTVPIGTSVMYAKNTAIEITIDGDKYILIKEKDILGTL